MNITLIGFMGTGKTSAGRKLARRLGWRFVDVDQGIESRAGMSVPRIFAERGEPVFRRLEQRCLAHVLRGEQQVIATGGGAFIDSSNRARLHASGPVICLTARPRTILARIGQRIEARPLLRGGDPLTRIRTLLNERASAYAKADITIDTSDLSVDEVVERLWERLSPYWCKSWQYLLDHAGALSRRYGGRYIVVIDNHIVASGETQLEAYQKIRLSHGRSASGKQETGIYYIPLPEESLTAL